MSPTSPGSQCSPARGGRGSLIEGVQVKFFKTNLKWESFRSSIDRDRAAAAAAGPTWQLLRDRDFQVHRRSHESQAEPRSASVESWHWPPRAGGHTDTPRPPQPTSLRKLGPATRQLEPYPTRITELALNLRLRLRRGEPGGYCTKFNST